MSRGQNRGLLLLGYFGVGGRGQQVGPAPSRPAGMLLPAAPSPPITCCSYLVLLSGLPGMFYLCVRGCLALLVYGTASVRL